MNLPCSVNSTCSLCSQEIQLSSCVWLLAYTVKTFLFDIFGPKFLEFHLELSVLGRTGDVTVLHGGWDI